jgi:hypothetical protein
VTTFTARRESHNVFGENGIRSGSVVVIQPLQNTNQWPYGFLFGDFTHTMKRHILLALLRMVLAVGVVCALPLSHSKWGEPYPGDGQQGFAFFIIFTLIGMVAGLSFVGIGSLAQMLLRRRKARVTVIADVALFLFFAGVLAYAGVTAKYHDTPPNKSQSQSIGGVFSSTFAAR